MSFASPPHTPLNLDAVNGALKIHAARIPASTSPTLVPAGPLCQREIFRYIAGDNPAAYERARSWIPNLQYWEAEENHFRELNNIIGSHHSVESGRWYKDLTEVLDLPPMDILEDRYRSSQASWAEAQDVLGKGCVNLSRPAADFHHLQHAGSLPGPLRWLKVRQEGARGSIKSRLLHERAAKDL